MNSPPPLWDDVLRRLGADTAPVVLEAWLQPLEVRQETDRLVLVAPTAFHRERVRSRFGERIRALAEEIAGRPLALAIEVAAAGPAPAGPVRVPAPARSSPPCPAPSPP
ncbi:MAG: DnaA N-terminal domain-containing protein, partial [Myxococcota bacterium]